MSISKKLDETLENLELTSAAAAARDSVISRSMNNLREKMSKMDVKVEGDHTAVSIERKATRYEESKTELADVARKVYRDNINPVDKKEVEEKAPKNQPSTIAGRANIAALSRSLAGMRSSGNVGKTSFVGSNGSGNVGKLSPTGANDSGNVTNNANNYYALTTDMTLEEYESYVNNIFEGEDCGCDDEKEKTKKEIKARGGPPGKKDPSMTKEDAVFELQDRLITMGSTDWIVVDQVLREFAQLLDVTPRSLSRDFKSVNGIYPDKWIKEHLDVEVCGFLPLDEAVRLNKVGRVYEVTFMFRGGTNRLKFFWPMAGEPTKEQMQYEVEKFWPKARLLAYYPTIDNEQQTNYMVCAPPMTENYHFMEHDTWVEMSEAQNEIYNLICEEEGEPLSPPLIEDDGTISVIIEDHDDGEQREVLFSEKRGLWDNIHAKRKRGEKPAKKGDKDYPETLNIESLDQARKNVGADKCWDGYKAKGTKKKDGKVVPNCVKEADMTGAPSIKDAKPRKKTNVKYDKHMNVMAPTIKEGDEMKGMSQKSGDKRSTDSGAGMTAQGVAKYNRRTGGNLKTAVTTPPSKLKPGSKAAGRRKSFCARSRSWNGERGKAARRRWNC